VAKQESKGSGEPGNGLAVFLISGASMFLAKSREFPALPLQAAMRFFWRRFKGASPEQSNVRETRVKATPHQLRVIVRDSDRGDARANDPKPGTTARAQKKQTRR
jgi:hypothetical protein